MAEMTPFERVRSQAILHNAWRKVRENGLQSPCKDTREKVREFDRDVVRGLRQIADQLRGIRFRFEPQIGIRKRRAGKTPRPLVVAAVRNRIVQRAILDVLQLEPAIQEILSTPTSFGGIRDRGVRCAIATACRTIEAGAKYYIRSDIQDFFARIPRLHVLAQIEDQVRDPDFTNLLHAATDTILANLDEIGEDAYLFPLREMGVAQGSPLSPLLGNILLRDLDRDMNARGITCLRYIDDLILFGPTASRVRKAFESAQRSLGSLGMRAYDPRTDATKAEEGDVSDGFTFLGCHIGRGSLIQPVKAAKKKLLASVKDALTEGRRGIVIATDEGRPKVPQRRYVQALTDVDNILKGWGHAFSFCNGRMVFTELDRKIDEMLSDFKAFAGRYASGKSQAVHRRILGVHLLEDTPYLPLQA